MFIFIFLNLIAKLFPLKSGKRIYNIFELIAVLSYLVEAQQLGLCSLIVFFFFPYLLQQPNSPCNL